MNVQGKNVVILGIARSGLAAAQLLQQMGAKIIVNDRKPREACSEAVELEKLNVPVIYGYHPDDLVNESVDLVVKNPGIPYQVKPIQRAIQLGIPIVTEVEVASWLTQSPIIAITGSNGKTTTTTLVGEMLQQAGIKRTVAGNIGHPMTQTINDLDSDEWLVAELSSFQLKGTRTFHPQIAGLLNIYPAHLDYHETLEDYVSSKRRIFVNQNAEDIAILNAHPEQTHCQSIASQISGTVWWFSSSGSVSPGIYIEDEWITVDLPNRPKEKLLPVQEVQLPGQFNLENALAATAIAIACGASVEAISQTLRTFSGVEHRLQFVRELDGVRYFNDSKATNAQAATKAITSFQEPLIWIAGGLDRGVDFKELVPVLTKQNIKAVIVYGESAPILKQRAEEAGIDQVVEVSEVETAVIKARQIAKEKEVVLLSPACASWDLYSSFEERGSIFIQTVHSL